jgi:hypothetical protein
LLFVVALGFVALHRVSIRTLDELSSCKLGAGWGSRGELITSRLEESDGADWFEKRATSPMKLKVTDRKQKEERDLWHTGRNKLPIYYLDFGDLSKLIVNHWVQFEDLLPGQPWVQARLDEAEKSRNVIAHTNVLAPEEVDRLEMYLSDWIKQIG